MFKKLVFLLLVVLLAGCSASEQVEASTIPPVNATVQTEQPSEVESSNAEIMIHVYATGCLGCQEIIVRVKLDNNDICTWNIANWPSAQAPTLYFTPENCGFQDEDFGIIWDTSKAVAVATNGIEFPVYVTHGYDKLTYEP